MPTNVVTAATDIRYCKPGDQGVEVQRWQYFLRSQAGVFPKPPLNGTFDAATESATTSFQRMVNPLEQPSYMPPKVAVSTPALSWLDNSWLKPAPAGGTVMMTGRLDQETAEAAKQRGYAMPTAPYSSVVTSGIFPSAPTKLVSPSHQWRASTFGSFEFEHVGDNGDIRFCDDWETKNIVKVQTPQLAHIGYSSMRFHKDAADRLVKLLQSWERAKLLHLILTYAGAFVPRYMRGKAPKAGEAEDATKLSNHTWGTAFDINAAWNGLYRIPAILPAIGCVRELANIAEASGFYWGGHYKPDRKGNTRQDGMHFEIGQPAT